MENQQKEKKGIDVVEGNALIAGFMGKVVTTQNDLYIATSDGSICRYDCDWSWLMPVVEKINNLAIDDHGEMGVWISPHKCAIGENEHNEIKSHEGYQSPLINLVWLTIVEFIKWYNQNKTP